MIMALVRKKSFLWCLWWSYLLSVCNYVSVDTRWFIPSLCCFYVELGRVFAANHINHILNIISYNDHGNGRYIHFSGGHIYYCVCVVIMWVLRQGDLSPHPAVFTWTSGVFMTNHTNHCIIMSSYRTLV